MDHWTDYDYDRSDAWKLGYTDRIEAGCAPTDNPFSEGTEDHTDWLEGFFAGAVTLERASFLAEVITTAVEGGIDYWAEVHGYEFEYIDLGGERDWAEATVREWGCANIAPGPWTHITPDLLSATLSKIAAACPPWMDNKSRKVILAAWAVLDSGDIDSTLADQIIQVACFDEVRYG